MHEEVPAIEVLIMRDSRMAVPPSAPVSIRVDAIASVEDATPVGPVHRGQPRCRIVLRDSPTEPVPWIFSTDVDEESSPRELLVAETLMQVTALMESAARNNCSVSVEYLGREVAAAASRPVRVAPMPPVRFKPRPRGSPEK